MSHTTIIKRLGYDLHLTPDAKGVKMEVYTLAGMLIALDTGSNEANALELGDYAIDLYEQVLTAQFDAQYPPVEVDDYPAEGQEQISDPSVNQLDQEAPDTVQPTLQPRRYRHPVVYTAHVWINGWRANAYFMSYNRTKQQYQVDWYLSNYAGSLDYRTSEYITDPHEKHLFHLWTKAHLAAPPPALAEVEQAFKALLDHVRTVKRLPRNSRQLAEFTALVKAWWDRFGKHHNSLLDPIRQRWQWAIQRYYGISFPIRKDDPAPEPNRAISRQYDRVPCHKWDRDNDAMFAAKK